MLKLAIIFFVCALIAGILGFGGLAGTLAGAAELVFWAFIVLFLVSAIVSAIQGRGVTV